MKASTFKRLLAVADALPDLMPSAVVRTHTARGVAAVERWGGDTPAPEATPPPAPKINRGHNQTRGRPRNNTCEADRLGGSMARGELIPSHMFDQNGEVKPEHREDVAAIRRRQTRETDRGLLQALAESRR